MKKWKVRYLKHGEPDGYLTVIAVDERGAIDKAHMRLNEEKIEYTTVYNPVCEGEVNFVTFKNTEAARQEALRRQDAMKEAAKLARYRKIEDALLEFGVDAMNEAQSGKEDDVLLVIPDDDNLDILTQELREKLSDLGFASSLFNPTTLKVAIC